MSDEESESRGSVANADEETTSAARVDTTDDAEEMEVKPSAASDDGGGDVGDVDGNDDTGNLKNDEQDNDNEKKEREEQAQERSTVPEEPSKPTDEYGRPLSAYEIMRLERIKRNQAYLAKLGLEADVKTGKSKTLLGDEAPKKPRPKKKTEVQVLRRSSVSRRTKTKDIDYTEKTVKRKEDILTKTEKKKKVPKPKKVKSEKQQKREDRLPLFIYREFKRIETTRNKNLHTAEKLNRKAENEVRMTQRSLDALERKTKRLRERETRNDMLPIVHEIDKRKSDIIRGLKKVDKSVKHGLMSEEERRVEITKEVEEARMRFPEAIREVEAELGQMLLERLPPIVLEDVSNEGGGKKSKSKKGKKQTDADGESEDVGVGVGGAKGESKAISVSAVPMNLDLEELRKVEQNLKVRVQKARNVGGPVTLKLAAAVNRKWLENDAPVAASYNEYVPQVGDIVLYYPCAHYEFLRKHPDTRCKKNRLLLRRTLWERAIDEKKQQEQPKKKGSDDEGDENAPTSKRKKIENDKPWWTMEWMSTIQRGAGRYPILCRVEKESAEFPYDQESQTEIRRFHYDTNKAKSGDGRKKIPQEKEGRQKPSRYKPPMCLAVTLKPLAPVLPPSASDCEETLSPPPVFSVLTFPSNKSPFLIPFAFAYRSSLMFQEHDHVKLVENDGARRNAKVISLNEDDPRAFEYLAEAFEDIVRKKGDIDISSVQKLDSLIADAYSKSNADFLLTEADFRAAVQTILYQIHTRKAKGKSATETEDHRVQKSSQVNRVNATVMVAELVNLVRSSIPRWGAVKIKMDSDEVENFACPWQLELSGNDDNDVQEGAMSAALAPSILISSNRVSVGGLVHLVDESLRGQLESVLKYLMENDDQCFAFIPPVTDAIASEYSRFVPSSMCFRRILRRLKKQRIKYTRSSTKNGEVFLEEQGYGENSCCYYRSIGSLHSDISDVFQNCLIYNSPDSDIVLSAFHVTHYLKIVVDKVAENWHRERDQKRKAEITQIMNAESAARGEVLLKGKKKTSIPANEVDEYGSVFDRALDRAWMNTVLPDDTWNSRSTGGSESSSSGLWLPQCGDRVIYNRMQHGKFINGHFDILKNIQRSLPSILPPTNKKKKKMAQDRKKDSNEDDRQTDSELYQYWLGTIVWVRAVFPNPEAGQASVDLSPLYAIGIKFHYKWLAKRVQVVYWKPCSSTSVSGTSVESAPNDRASICKCCGLSLHQSFLSPSWIGPIDRILPPYPLSLAHVNLPSGISTDKIEKIKLCGRELKNRVINNTALDAFMPHENLLDCVIDGAPNIPQRFRYIFEDTECAEERNGEKEVSAFPSVSSNKQLSKVAFIAPWAFDLDEAKERNVSTRGNKPVIEKDGVVTMHFHETIIANPGLSLEFIHERLKCGFYRSTAAIVNDLREASIGATLYTVKERIQSKRLGKASEQTVLKAVVEACGVDINAFLSEDNTKTKSTKGKIDKNINTVNDSNHNDVEKMDQSNISESSKPRVTVKLNNLNHQERAVINDIRAIYRLYATAIVTCIETPIAEMALSLERQNPLQSDGAPNKDQELARQNLNWMLSSLGPDKMKFRKSLASSDESPTVNVFVKVKTHEDVHEDPNISSSDVPEDPDISSSSDATIPQSIILTPSDYENNPTLLKFLCPSANGSFRVRVQVSIKMQDASNDVDTIKKAEIVFNPDEYKKSRVLYKFLPPFKRGKALLPIKVSVVSKCFDLIPNEQNSFNADIGHPLKIANSSVAVEDCKEDNSGTSAENILDIQSDTIDDGNDKEGNMTRAEIGNDGITETTNKDNVRDESSIPVEAGMNTDHSAVDSDDLDDIDITKPLTFVPADYYNNASLVRALFCRSKRKQVCARCVLSKKGLFTCRVRSAHSNLDPSWIDYYRSKVGVDGILALLDQDYQPQIEPYQSQDSPGEDIESTVDQSETLENKDDEDNLRSAINSATEVQAKANKAQELSRVLLLRAKKEMELPILLSSEFMHSSFIVDPDDGHFEICPKCGLGGDVICCESCPMVSHPKCAGMDEIPDEDWHCDACTAKEKEAGNTMNSLDGSNGETFAAAAEDSDDNEKVAEKLASVLDALKSSRQKQLPIELGTKLFRDFDGKSYLGWVIELPSEHSEYYKVQYEDDDEEDFTNEEIQLCIAAYIKMQKSGDDVEAPRIIGRPRKYPVEVSAESNGTTKQRGRPRKNRDISPVEEDRPRKRGRPPKVKDDNPEIPLKSRGRGRPPKIRESSHLEVEIPRQRGRTMQMKRVDQAPRKRGRPRKDVKQNSSPPRKRGRPRKDVKQNSSEDEAEESPDHIAPRKRGRPRKSVEAETKKSRGRSRKQNNKTPTPQADISDENVPNPGHIDKNMTYYCTKENDTAVKIASIIGCDSWLDVAYIPENLERFPALQDKKIKFRKGTLVRIAEASFAIKKAVQLVE